MQKLTNVLELVVLVTSLTVLTAVIGGIIYFGVSGFQGDHRSKEVTKHLDQSRENIVKEVAVCVVDAKLPKNPVYYNLPILSTSLNCEGPVKGIKGKPTLKKLIDDGWSLVQVIDPQKVIGQGKQQRRAFAALYLQRNKSQIVITNNMHQ